MARHLLPNFCYRQRKPVAGGKCHASFFIGYRFGGEQKKFKLGDASVISADEARRHALAHLGDLTKGIDPQAAKDAARIEAAKITFAEAVTQYLAAKATDVRANSLRTMRLYLTGSTYFATLNGKAIDRVTVADIQSRLDQISTDISAASAGQARASLNSFFEWALCRSFGCKDNPVERTEKPKADVERERVLSDDELKTIWNACDDSDYGRIVKLLILTGCRREEIGAMRWSEINLDAGTFTLPVERSKNHRAHTLPSPARVGHIHGRGRIEKLATLASLSPGCLCRPPPDGAQPGPIFPAEPGRSLSSPLLSLLW
jgi:integrase